MFYVYAYLRDDGSPYYVGKGKDKRGMRYKSQILLLCPHCNKTGGASNMKRYHIDNCKSIGV